MEGIQIQCNCPTCNNMLIVSINIQHMNILNTIPIDTYCNFCLYKKEKQEDTNE